MRRAVLILVVAGALLAVGATLSAAGTGLGPDPGLSIVGPTTAAVPTATTDAPTLVLAKSTAPYRSSVRVSGTVAGAGAGTEIVVEIANGDGWAQLATTQTDSSGAFGTVLEATRSGKVRARNALSGAVSAEVPLEVTPLVKVTTRPGRAFGGAKLSARVSPASYAGRVTIVVKQDGRTLAHTRGLVRHGHLRVTVPTPGVGSLWIAISFPSAAGLSATEVGARVSARPRTLSVGSSGADVRALSQRLSALHVHVPEAAWSFSYELYDSVVAFQKAYRLPRTGVVGPETWRALARANLLRPRYRGPALHIEVDKTRQILMVVHGGNVESVIPVSTGATGNTPEGRHRILWKAPYTTTWLGSAILYRTLDFYANSFAIHGYPSVPVYPASHGCVRIPIWTADWLYNQSPVGETVYVYR